MSGDIRLRAFEPADLAALQSVRRAAFAPVFESFRTLTGPDIAPTAFASADAEQAELLDGICREGAEPHVIVALVGEAIVGFVSFTADPAKGMGEIGLNAVHPDHAGVGIGTRMYEEVLSRMKALGVAVAEVGTGGDPSHAPARRAYEKAGFGPSIPSITLYKRL